MGLDTVELVMKFEEQFGIEIPDAIAETMVTSRNVRDFVVSEYLRQGRSADPEMVFEKIRDITAGVSGVRRDQVGLDTSFVEDLGMD